MTSTTTVTTSTTPDKAIQDIVDYVVDYQVKSEEALRTARYVLMDSIGCALLALQYPQCTKLLGPLVEGTIVPNGVRIPGTKHVLDPVTGAFNIGAMIRWLDYNDTWLAAEWGHPSDNLGAILSVADYLAQHGRPITLKNVLEAMIKAHEIQGCLALENAFNRVGLDHVILVRIASTAVATWMLGGSKEQIFNALSNAWIDGGALRTYRHFPNTGSRKSWAAGDACQRAVWHAFNALRGEMGYPTALSAKTWGWNDVQFQGRELKFQRPYGEYVMENVLFKVNFPAEFHAQTAVECALALHPEVKDKLSEIKAIHIHTQEPAVRIIDKRGPLTNPADRDHCLQYMIAIPLIYGSLVADHYEDSFHAANTLIDELREKMVVHEDKHFSEDYLDPEKRSIANAIQVEFNDGSKTENVVVEYPIGHRRRREESFPLLEAKARKNIAHKMTEEQQKYFMDLCLDADKLHSTPASELMAQLVAK